jgi:C4-dicarboxylate-specific signal transduction histidine kinase
MVQQLSPPWHASVTRAAELPPEASADRESLAGLRLQTVLINPLVGGDGLLGALVCGAPEEALEGSELSSSLRLVGNVLAGVLERKAAEDLLRTSELMKTSILQSLTTGVVVVDGESIVLAQNHTWLELARAAGCVGIAVGSSFLEALETAAAAGNRLAARVADALTAVLAGVQPRVVLEHTSETGAETRWWSVQVVPLTGARRGAVVTRADITDVRRAELEALRSRQDLAHVARVATVGELTASIAHQLNQPLSAIMTNAQAASRILEWTEPDLEEVRAILIDIVKDDRRASEVIGRVRELLRNGELQMQWIDLSALIREVADLLSSETIIRDVALSLSFDRVPIYAKGDRVQLQQVVLNLIQNAMEAMSVEHRSGRVIHVSCRAEENGPVHVSVQDSGPGVRMGAEQTIFEPFYTTKSGGMGMGLSIVRSIVEAHGGSIRVRNHASGGAIFEFTLQRAIIRPVA